MRDIVIIFVKTSSTASCLLAQGTGNLVHSPQNYYRKRCSDRPRSHSFALGRNYESSSESMEPRAWDVLTKILAFSDTVLENCTHVAFRLRSPLATLNFAN